MSLGVGVCCARTAREREKERGVGLAAHLVCFKNGDGSSSDQRLLVCTCLDTAEVAAATCRMVTGALEIRGATTREVVGMRVQSFEEID